ncbi:MAG: vanadium-dependent haloperoxidase [Pseudomonadota bacterium]
MKSLGLMLTLSLSVGAHAYDAKPVVNWNTALLEMAQAEDGFLTLKGLRTVTMMHIAMHDALNAVDPRYRSFALSETAPQADAPVAMCEAAFRAAVSQYPDRTEALEALHTPCLTTDASTVRKSIALGKRAANAILKRRDDDGWDTEADYQWHPMAPGVYAEFEEHSGTPEGFIFGAGWARAQPFALSQPDQFRAPPPPKIASDAYARAFHEVKAVGRFQSMERTPDQMHLALWWKDFAENSHNRLARDLIDKDDLAPHNAVRLLALLNIAIYDAYVSSFDNKFHYNHWRPYTAIRWAERDGNPDTQAEPTWTNTHRHTYAFPSYPSAHGTACAAAMSVFEEVFGADYAFTMRTPTVDVAGPFSGKIEMQPPTRSFATFREAADECGASRVYLGIHFRYDSVAGVALGRQVGEHAIARRLRPATD